MKLNNHGWGLNQMLIYCAIILFFLMISVFFIIQLSNALGDTIKKNVINENTYSDIENIISSAAVDYIEKYYENDLSIGTVTVPTKNLLHYNLITESRLVTTPGNDECYGYALVKKEADELTSHSYIKCSNYETNGFQSWRLGE